MPGKKLFHSIRPIPGIENENDPDGHGSCVASKVAGPEFGVAKNANIVMIKLPRKMLLGEILSTLTWIDADVTARNLRGKAVLNLSIGCKYINPSIGEPDLTSTRGPASLFESDSGMLDSFR